MLSVFPLISSVCVFLFADNMKLSIFLVTATLAASASAFAPKTAPAKSTAIRSSATPEDFIATSSLPASVLERLNEDKVKRGKPLMETILDPNYNAAIATAMGGPLAAILLNGK